MMCPVCAFILQFKENVLKCLFSPCGLVPGVPNKGVFEEN